MIEFCIAAPLAVFVGTFILYAVLGGNVPFLPGFTSPNAEERRERQRVETEIEDARQAVKGGKMKSSNGPKGAG